MNINEFLAELKRYVPATVWQLTKDRFIRAQHAAHDSAFCPITALAYWRDGEHFTIADADGAAHYLDIEDDLSGEIVDAADGTDNCSRAVRRKLLTACGLQD